MRFIIYGAGAIGGTVGGHLALGGHDVLLVARSQHRQAIREHGLHFVTPQDTYILHLPAVGGPGEIDFQRDDVVFLCVKSQDTQSAIRDLSSQVTDVPVFCFQNGVRNEEVVAQYVEQVYGVMVRIGGTYLRPGEIVGRRDPPGAVALGRFPEGVDDLAESVAAALRSVDFAVLVVPDVMRHKWGKLLANLGNAVGAITNSRDYTTDRIAEAARVEARAILTRAGVDWMPHERLRQVWPDLERPVRGHVEIEAYSSTWQSLARQQGTAEAEQLNGEIVRLAEQVGMDAPINRTLTDIVMDMAAQKEPPGRYTPLELSDLLGLTHDDEARIG